MSDKPRVSLVTLGCAKNIVDSEYLAGQFEANGFIVAHEHLNDTDVLIINTCGFINDAKIESIDTIMDSIEAKKNGQIKKLYVMGCLSKRYKTELEVEIPEVDGFFGVDEQRSILNNLKAEFQKEYSHERILYTPDHYAYLKIAEGCNRKCSFCSIPLIRGEYKSKPIENIKEQAAFLDEKGVKELNIIAQDLSYYGYDLYKKYALADLLRELSSSFSFKWLRLLYLYPNNFPTEILDVMKEYQNICNYLDIPFQHINEKVLKNMRRGINRKKTYELIELIKNKIPGASLRTTLLVGHPGEGDKEFRELLDFVKNIRFDRLGVFTYSEEEGTYSAQNYKDSIPKRIKQERADQVMEVQQQISLEKNRSKTGKKLEVLIDREDEHNYFGRAESDAPEVDNEIFFRKEKHSLQVGSFYLADIKEAYEYDLVGEILNEKPLKV